jgi:hypothetical protein
MKLIFCLVVTFSILIINAKSSSLDSEDSMSNSRSNEELFSENDSSERFSNSLVDQLDLLEKKMKQAENLGFRINKKSMKPIVHNGYTLDINIDTFKSTVC